MRHVICEKHIKEKSLLSRIFVCNFQSLINLVKCCKKCKSIIQLYLLIKHEMLAMKSAM